MKDSRIGEALWSEWDGEYPDLGSSRQIFYTTEHVNLENEIVRRALASALQRDGSAVSLGEGYKMVESASTVHTWAGTVDGETTYTVCEKDGETREGDYVDSVVEVTLVLL
ncbi:hypothetical protein [Actinomycetia phage DSL-LC01]|nr:hypothetical protein [Actinomycetia phage DSL-LC01]